MAEDILIAVAHAESLRRQRLLTRQLLRVVPIAAGALLVTAALVRVLHAPLVMFWLVSGAVVAGVAVFGWIGSRVPAVTDAAATRLDADAALGGELRSAHWFASHPAADAWVAHHVAGAADRVETIFWPAVYPPVKTARVWAGSAALVITAFAVAMTTAWPAALQRSSGGAEVVGGADGLAPEGRLSEELQKQIDELIRAVQRGAMPMDVAREKIAELRDKLSVLDPQMQAALAKAAQAQSQKSGEPGAGGTDAKAAELADRAEQAAAKADLPQDMKWSLQDLATKLAKASESQGQPGEKSESAGQKGAAKTEAGAMQKPDGAAEMTRSTDADAQSSQMMATASPMGGEARGAGKDDPKKSRMSAPLDLSALRKETIEADEDTQGANVLAEMRRKSEQSHSAMAFSRVAPLAAYDKSHAVAPPPPPAALRALVRQYFIRK